MDQPLKANRPVVIWLLTGCFLIFCMVIIGGITRLTGSGLSITEWKPIMGAIPPLNEKDWAEAFHKYKQIPQYSKINYDFTVEEFKSIFWWEYIHRQIGRLIGMVFIIPFFWFLFKRKFDPPTIKKVFFLFLLGALQGFIGWYMVSSGLTERTSVSHIRLAIHLITAFVTFGFTMFFALELQTDRGFSTPGEPLRNHIRLLFGLILLQVIYGALVAGTHAGKIFNTFPLMNGKFIPTGMGAVSPWTENLVNNPVALQFIHRFLAGIITILTLIIIIKSRNLALNKFQKSGLKFLAAMLGVQLLLGILTLLTHVNIVLASLHQVGAFALFSGGIYLLFHFQKLKNPSALNLSSEKFRAGA